MRPLLAIGIMSAVALGGYLLWNRAQVASAATVDAANRVTEPIIGAMAEPEIPLALSAGVPSPFAIIPLLAQSVARLIGLGPKIEGPPLPDHVTGTGGGGGW